MSWWNELMFSGIAFIIGYCIGVIIETLRGGKEIDEIWRLHRDREKINQEIRYKMITTIEKLEHENLEQRYIIKSFDRGMTQNIGKKQCYE